MQWILDHWTILGPAVGGFIAASIDLAWTINPNWKTNGPLHWVYVKLTGKEPS